MSQQPLPQPPKYKIYATILDAFQWYQDSQQDTAFQDLIDKINRVPFSSEAADKGTAFNDVVDMYLHGQIALHPSGLFLHNGFAFEEKLVTEFASNLHGATPQVRMSAPVHTRYGLVELYGVMDELMMGTVVDIKTTKQYTFPKYLRAWQHIVYPCILRHHTGMDYAFAYLVTDFKDIYCEDYQYSHERDYSRLVSFLESFIEFLEQHRELITDLKIFNQEPSTLIISKISPSAMMVEAGR
jgi:hypothetical protein